jgi:RES domain-containing protein
MRLYRIANATFADTAAKAFSGLGVTYATGRWNWKRDDIRAVYLADSLALACLETLVHIRSRPRVFPRSVYYAVDVPDALIEHPVALPAGWADDVSQASSRNFGTEFLLSGRAAGLAVPTVVQNVGTNVLLNVRHPSFELAWVSTGPLPYEYDARLD